MCDIEGLKLDIENIVSRSTHSNTRIQFHESRIYDVLNLSKSVIPCVVNEFDTQSIFLNTKGIDLTYHDVGDDDKVVLTNSFHIGRSLSYYPVKKDSQLDTLIDGYLETVIHHLFVLKGHLSLPHLLTVDILHDMKNEIQRSFIDLKNAICQVTNQMSITNFKIITKSSLPDNVQMSGIPLLIERIIKYRPRVVPNDRQSIVYTYDHSLFPDETPYGIYVNYIDTGIEHPHIHIHPIEYFGDLRKIMVLYGNMSYGIAATIELLVSPWRRT